MKKNKPLQDGHTYIIAEAGSNHNRELDQAKKLVDIAAQSGCDAVKFQLFRAENFYPLQDPVFAVMKEAEFPREWLDELYAYTLEQKIDFLASVFDLEAVDLLINLGVNTLKIASSDAVNLRLVRYAASKASTLIISTAMCCPADIYESVEAARSGGSPDIILLQCTAKYPSDPSDADLKTMDTLREMFKCPVGFSDHSLGTLLPALAAARGACVIEKHFTLDKTMPGPDHSYALEPDELREMVEMIRLAEKALGSGIKTIHPDEKPYARRESLFAARTIAAGEPISRDAIEIKRPATGIPTRFLSAVVHSRASCPIEKGAPLNWNMVEPG